MSQKMVYMAGPMANAYGYNPRTVYKVNFFIRIPQTNQTLETSYEVPPGHEYTTLMKNEIIEYDWGSFKNMKARVTHAEKEGLPGLDPTGKKTEYYNVYLMPVL